MLKRSIFLLFMLAPVALAAQQNFASISFGASKPMGNYGETGDLSGNGYAKLGGAIKFDGAYFPVSYLGFGGSFSFGSNYANRDSLLSDMITYVLGNSSSIVDIPDDAEILYGSGFWNYINLFLGPHFSVRPAQRLYFDFRALAGFSVVRPPDQELNITFDGTEIHSQTSKSKLSFGFTTGAGLRYRLNPDLALKLGIDYFQSKANYDLTFQLLQPVAENITPLESEFIVRTLELTVGLAYAF